jgi:hypothetical protein
MITARPRGYAAQKLADEVVPLAASGPVPRRQRGRRMIAIQGPALIAQWESRPGPEMRGGARRRVAAAVAAGIPSMSGHELRNRSHREIAIANPLETDHHGRPAPRRNPARLLLARPAGGSPPSLGRGRSQTGPGMPAAWLPIYGRRLHHSRRCMSVEEPRWPVTRSYGYELECSDAWSANATAKLHVVHPGTSRSSTPAHLLTSRPPPRALRRPPERPAAPSWSLRAHGFQ